MKKAFFLLLLPIALVGCASNAPTSSQGEATSSVATSTKTVNGDNQVYADDQLGFQISYPKNWRVCGGAGDITFCNSEHGGEGYDGDWFIFVHKSSEKTIDDIIGGVGDQWGKDRKEVRTPITINGYPATRAQIFVKDSLWVDSVFLEKDGKIFWIEDGAGGNPGFSDFYSSFKFI